MPLTAPVVTDAATRLQISMAFVDQSGDIRSIAVNTLNVGVTRAQIQAMVAAYAAASKANLYRVSIEEIYDAGADTDDALGGQRNGVYENVVILFRNPSVLAGVNTYIPAPTDTVMPANTDIPPDSAPLEAVTDTTEVVLGAGWDDRSVRFTDRRDKNERRIT